MFRRIPALLVCALLLFSSVLAGAAKLGLSSYGDELPPGQHGPQETIYKTANVTGATPTNEWYSPVVWAGISEPKYIYPIHPHPLTLRYSFNGLEAGYPTPTTETENDGETEIIMAHHTDLLFTGDKWWPTDTRLDGYGDWSASFLMTNAKQKSAIRTTAAHGSPFIYLTYNNVRPVVKFSGLAKVWYGDEKSQAIGVKVNQSYYGFFAPTGSTWVIDADRITCNLPKGKNFLSAALLPDGTQSTLEYFENHAYAFITDTRVSWSYDQETSTVKTDFTVITKPMEGANDKTIMALYPHQWRFNVSLSPLPYTYASIRGTMKVIEGNVFRTATKFHGILPWLPDMGDYDRAKLQAFINDVRKEGDHIRYGPGRPGILDPYTMGKNLSRLATVLPIAEQLGDRKAADEFRTSLAEAIQDYFTATPGKMKNLFAYEKRWGTMLGFPPGFGSDIEINDHHFHYGYFTYAASALALRDKSWGSDDRWGGMMKELIRDMANWNRSDKKYPFLRNFDPYAGHSWASGTGRFADGNNQESSSEAINAWVGLILWGEATGDKTIRDLGVYLYTTEVTAVQNYWFDIYGDVFPPEYTNTDCSMVWGGKIAHTTWWTESPIETKAINFMPITGGSLYLGYDASYVLKNYGELEKKANKIGIWPGLVYSYLALADPDKSLQLWDPNIGAEFGETNAHTYHWICNLRVMGRVDSTVTADTALYSVFVKNGKRTYVAYNASDKEITVNFSDGQRLTVPANQMATSVK